MQFLHVSCSILMFLKKQTNTVFFSLMMASYYFLAALLCLFRNVWRHCEAAVALIQVRVLKLAEISIWVNRRHCSGYSTETLTEYTEGVCACVCVCVYVNKTSQMSTGCVYSHWTKGSLVRRSIFSFLKVCKLQLVVQV